MKPSEIKFTKNNGITNKYIIENCENSDVRNKLLKFPKSQPKLNHRTYSINKFRIKLSSSDELQMAVKKLKQDNKNTINSYVSKDKNCKNEELILFDNHSDNSNQFRFQEKLSFPNSGMIQMMPKSMRDTFFSQKLSSNPIAKSMNGSYYKKRNNSVIIIKDKNSLFNNENFDCNNISNISPDKDYYKLPKKLKNITMEHLKDLLDIKTDKDELDDEEFAPLQQSYPILNPFKSYLERTRMDNARNLNNKNIENEIQKLKEKNRIKQEKKYLLKEDLNKNVDLRISQEILDMQKKNEYKAQIKAKRENKAFFSPNNPEIKSSGVQCVEKKFFESPINNEEITANKDSENLVSNNIITNAKLRDNIKWEKLKPKEDENDYLNINMYSPQFVEGKNEIFKLYFNNKINYLDSRFKLKTPNDLKSKIGTQHTINIIKKGSSAKPKIINSIYCNSYAKEVENLQYFPLNQIKTKIDKPNKFWNNRYIEEKKDSNKYKGQNNKKNLNLASKEKIPKSENIEDNIKILKKRVYSPIDNNVIVYKNIGYNLKNEQNENKIEYLNKNNKEDPKSTEKLSHNYNPTSKDNNKNYCSKELDNANNAAFNDKYNTLESLNNFVENSEKNKIHKNIQNLEISKNIANGKEAKELMIKLDKNINERANEKLRFLDKVDWRKNNTVKIIKGGLADKKSLEDIEIIHLDSGNFFQTATKEKKSISHRYFPNVNNSQYYNDETSKSKFKILKKQLNKESEKVFNRLDDLKKAQCDLLDSKRKFLIETTENKLKRFTRSSIRVPYN